MNDPDEYGRLPIHYACKRGDPDIVDFLLRKGAKVNVPDGDGRLPIHIMLLNTDV